MLTMPYQSDRYLVQYRRRKMFVYKGARDAQNGKGTSSLTVKLKMSRYLAILKLAGLCLMVKANSTCVGM